MPIMDGYELSDHIRKFHQANCLPQPMIVACTGHVEDEFIKRAWVNQIDEVLTKPVGSDALRLVFNDILL